MEDTCFVCGCTPCVCGEAYKHLSDRMLLRLMHKLQLICVDRALAPKITILDVPLAAMIASSTTATPSANFRDEVDPTDGLVPAWQVYIKKYTGRTVFSMYTGIIDDPELPCKTALAVYILHKLNISNWKLFNVIAKLLENCCSEYVYPALLRNLVAVSALSTDTSLAIILGDLRKYRALADDVGNKSALASIAYIEFMLNHIFRHRRLGEKTLFSIKQLLFVINEVVLVGATEELTYRMKAYEQAPTTMMGDPYICEFADQAAAQCLMVEKESIPIDWMV